MRMLLALVALVLGTTACSGGDGTRAPERWPPDDATSCLKARPPVGNPIIFPAALAVRDWEQQIRSGVDLYFCAQGSPGGGNVRVDVTTTGAVGQPSPTTFTWDTTTDLVRPITIPVDPGGSGRITVTLRDPSDGPPAARQGMSVEVVDRNGQSVVHECLRTSACTFD